MILKNTTVELIKKLEKRATCSYLFLWNKVFQLNFEQAHSTKRFICIISFYTWDNLARKNSLNSRCKNENLHKLRNLTLTS